MDNQQRDEQLWQIAQNRASFKEDLYSYFGVNAFFWAVWLFTAGGESGCPWPVWTTLPWGIWLLYHYIDAYHGDENATAEKEYEKLQRERNAQPEGDTATSNS